MTDTDNLAALAAAVEAGDANCDHFGMVWPPNDRDAWRINCTAWEAFNGDLNAAVRLVEVLLPGWKVANIAQMDSGGWWAELRRGHITSYDGVALALSPSGYPNPARALLLAVLRAKMGISSPETA